LPKISYQLQSIAKTKGDLMFYIVYKRRKRRYNTYAKPI